MVFWLVVGGALALLLLGTALMDRSARRRGATTIHSSDIQAAVREGRRDGATGGHGYSDVSWSSWSRRNNTRR